jgi:hypothetical protein
MIGRTVLRGVVAGAVGTVAMDLVWYARYRRGGGESAFADWEIVRDVESWDQAPAPGQMGRKIVQTVLRRDVPVEQAPALTNVMHWAYGTTWAALYALRARRSSPSLLGGPGFGATVWASDYVTLPLAGLYEPIWRYDAQTLWQDLSAHLVFGTVTDLALRALGR